jgi:hypothetical protein
MFSNVQSIFKLHHDFLLPHLEERMHGQSVIVMLWHFIFVNVMHCRCEPDFRIGDILKRFAPFMKLYAEYIKNFDQSMKTIDTWLEKSTKFAAFMTEKQVRKYYFMTLPDYYRHIIKGFAVYFNKLHTYSTYCR